MMTNQKCANCNKVLPIDKFEWQKNRPHPRKICQNCRHILRMGKVKAIPNKYESMLAQHRIYKNNRYKTHKTLIKKQWIKSKYGIEDWENLAKKQNYRCAICNQVLDMGKNTHIDHCHKTKIVRGILCSKCNFGIGCFLDDKFILNSAIKYLEDTQE